MTDPNAEALRAAREIVCARFTALYHQNAIRAGKWDDGTLVQTALRELLANPISEGDEE